MRRRGTQLTDDFKALSRETIDYGAELGHRRHRVHRYVLDGAERHPGVGRLVRVLDEGKPAGVLDGQEAGGAVVQGAGKDYADDPRAVAPGRGAEERVDGGPVPVLPRPSRQPDRSWSALR